MEEHHGSKHPKAVLAHRYMDARVRERGGEDVSDVSTHAYRRWAVMAEPSYADIDSD